MTSNNENNHEYPITEGDNVCHVKDQNLTGVVTHIDRNLPHPTTCNVAWNDVDSDPDPGNSDIQWTNNLVKLDDL